MSKKVFLASRFAEFENIRKKIISHYEDSNTIDIVNLDPNGVDIRTPTIKSIDTVSTCDILLLLVGDTYGIIPKGYNLSITHLEYITALELGTPIIAIYIGKNNENFSTCFSGDDEHPKLKELKQRVFPMSLDKSITSSMNSQEANNSDIVCEKIDRFLTDKTAFQNDKNRPYGYGLKKKPSVYIPRKVEIKEIKSLILNKNKNIGIVGIGGIGKSILIADIVQSAEIREEFENVYAVDVGKTPDFQEIAVKLLNFIPHYRYFDLENIAFNNAINKLKDFFRNKKILLILDDVWDSSTIEKLNFINKESKIIVTTRKESAIVNFEPYSLGLLNDEESQNLFYGINNSKNIDSKLTKEVLAKTGKLPLAIKIIASRLKNKPAKLYSEFLDDFQISRVEYNVEDESQRNLYNVIEFTYNDLSNTVQNDLLHLSIFPEDAFIRIETLETYIGHKWADSIGELIEYHLITYEEDAHGTALYQFHDLIREYIVEKSKTLEEKIKRKFINSYYVKYDGQWKNIPYYESFFFKNFIQISKEGKIPDIGQKIAEGIIWQHSNLHEKTVEKIIDFLQLPPKQTAKKLLTINEFKGTIVWCLRILGNKDKEAIKFSKEYLNKSYIHFEIASTIITEFANYNWIIDFAEKWITRYSKVNPYITATCVKILGSENEIAKNYSKKVIITNDWENYDPTIIVNSIKQCTIEEVNFFFNNYINQETTSFIVVVSAINKLGIENPDIKNFALNYFENYPNRHHHFQITTKLIVPLFNEDYIIDFAANYLKTNFGQNTQLTSSCIKVFTLNKENSIELPITKVIDKTCVSYLKKYIDIDRLNTDLLKKRTFPQLISSIIRLLKYNTDSSRLFINNFLKKEIDYRGQNHIILESCLVNVPYDSKTAILFADYLYDNELLDKYYYNLKSKILLIETSHEERNNIANNIILNANTTSVYKKELLNSAFLISDPDKNQKAYLSILKDWRNQIKKITFKGRGKGNARWKTYYDRHIITCLELLFESSEKSQIISKMRSELNKNPNSMSKRLKETLSNYE